MKAGQMEPPAVPPELAALRAVEERVAALEALLLPRVPEWTAEQAAEFREKFAQLGAGHEIRLLPPAPVLTPETAKALVRECVTVVSPGETLVIRVPESWAPQQVEYYQEYADAATESGRIPFRVLVVIGEELGVARPEPGNSPDNADNPAA
jgi:hypothetical protein